MAVRLLLCLQDKVVSSISELYSFMDASDATLARKVLGEGASEQAADDASGAEHDQEEGEAGEERHGRLVRCTCAWRLARKLSHGNNCCVPGSDTSVAFMNEAIG